MAFGKKPKAPSASWDEIVLFHKDGSISGRTIVDSDDLEELSQYRWWIDGYGYALRKMYLPNGHRTSIGMHRHLLGLEYGDPRQGDHINGNRLDNRRANLRIVTKGQNAENKVWTKGKSKYRGVAWNTRLKKWTTSYCHKGKRVYCGSFSSEEEAAVAVSRARARQMPFSQDALIWES